MVYSLSLGSESKKTVSLSSTSSLYNKMDVYISVLPFHRSS